MIEDVWAPPRQAAIFRPPSWENKSSQRRTCKLPTAPAMRQDRDHGWGTGLAPVRGRVYVAMYVYSTDGVPVGFVFETNIYDLTGEPLGRIVGCRVHRFDGTYVGEWFRDMVVRRPEGRPRLIPPAPVPPRRPPVPGSYNLRAVVQYGYADAFGELRSGGGFLREAAE